MKTKLIISTQNPPRKYPDLTKIDGSVGQRVERLIQTIDEYETLDDLKEAFREIINAKDTHISKRKKSSYEIDMDRTYSKERMMGFLRDIYLNAAGLGLS